MHFNLHIELGNDAMQSSQDLVQALRGVAQRIQDAEYVEQCQQEGDDIDRGISDINGNHIGEWSLVEDE
jgi:hypothetical protein